MAKELVATRLRSMEIVKFRGLENLRLELGNQVTLICGKNGTSKSSLLGIAAQIFSFEKDNTNGSALPYTTITGKQFKSLPREHFRFSDKFDGPSSMAVNFTVHDGYTALDFESSLELTTRTTEGGAKKARPVVRGNTSIQGADNTSRNYTHPVIYLSLRRLIPITNRPVYTPHDYEYLTKNHDVFTNLSNELLNRTSTELAGTKGTVNSAVAFGDNYDENSVSAGEDNVGQIVLALLSFRKLKEEYPNYHGGLLLIDEADAGLFPAAQTKLLDVLHRECNDLKIQVIMTSHSPTMIERVHELSQKYKRNFKTLYLTDSYGPVQAMNNYSWPEIYADINTATIVISDNTKTPRVNVYVEDQEAQDFYAQLTMRQSIKKFTKPITNVTLGCSNYVNLIDAGIEEFSKKSIIILDADAKDRAAHCKTVVFLPGTLPPDQLIFEHLFNLPPEHDIWKNHIKFTRKVFTQNASAIISELSIKGDTVNLSPIIEARRSASKEQKRKLRDIFKKFYNTQDFQAFLKNVNPWKHWMSANESEVQAFREQVNLAARNALSSGFGMDTALIAGLVPQPAKALAKPAKTG